MIQKSQIFAIVGPSGIGKTDLGLSLCQELDAEIISCDSSMVYKMLDIGTGKPLDEDLKKHHLINIKEPWEDYTAFHAIQDIQNLVKEIQALNKNVLLVGGTMLYFNLLNKGYSAFPLGNAQLINNLKNCNINLLLHYIRKKDPNLKLSNENDKRKLVRIVEILLVSKKRYSDLKKIKTVLPLQIDHFIALLPYKSEDLKKKLETRWLKMIKIGFLDELKAIYNHSLIKKEHLSMQSIGYKQGWLYLEGRINFATFYTKVLEANYRLGKHQMKWIRRWKNEITSFKEFYNQKDAREYIKALVQDK